MTNLISGKEALIALGSGKEVEYKSIDGWGDASLIHAFEFLDNNYEFRLKPRTITINGIEVPAPFEPRDGELVFVLDNFGKDGFTSFNFDGVFFSINFGQGLSSLRQTVQRIPRAWVHSIPGQLCGQETQA